MGSSSQSTVAAAAAVEENGGGGGGNDDNLKKNISSLLQLLKLSPPTFVLSIVKDLQRQTGRFFAMGCFQLRLF